MIESIREPVESVLGTRLAGFTRLSGGFTHAMTGLAKLGDGTTVFLKAGLEEHSRPQVEAEIRHLGWLRGSFLPIVIASIVDPPVLILEDLSSGHWPEPYPEDLGILESALHELTTQPLPEGVDLPVFEPPGAEVLDRLVADASKAVPAAASWVEKHLSDISESISAISPDVALCHTDLWYSNLCFFDERVVIVDWSHLSIGPRWFDASTVSVDLVIEGRRPLRMEGAAGWAAAHTAWVVWSLAKGPGPAISHHDDWVVDNLELFDGAAWWLAWELGVEPPPQLTDRQVGWEAG